MQIIVIHNFWMRSQGFEIIKVENKTKEDADQIAKARCFELSSNFNSASYIILTIDSLPEERDLTLEERLTGKLKVLRTKEN